MKMLLAALLLIPGFSAFGSQMPKITVKGLAAATLAEASEFDHAWLGNFVTCGLDKKNDPYCEILTMDEVYVNSEKGNIRISGYAANDLRKLKANAGGDGDLFRKTGLACGHEIKTNGNDVFCDLSATLIEEEGANIIYEK